MLKQRVVRGSAVLAALNLIVKFLDLIAVAVVARLITPEEFGLIVIATTTLAIVNSVSELPVLDALVQMSATGEEDLRTAFTVNMLRGVLLSLALLLLSGPVAALYDDERLQPLLMATSLAPLLQGLASPAMTRHFRDIRFGPLALTTLAGKLLAVVLMLALALHYETYWILVAGLVTAPAFTTLASYWAAPWRIGLRLAGWTRIFAFAGWISISRATAALNTHADRLFVSWAAGKAALAHYAIGTDVAYLATYTLATPAMRPLFAAFVRIKEDATAFRSSYLRAQHIMAAILLPLGFGLGAVAAILVPLVFGDHWEPAILVIQLLAPATAMQALTIPLHAALTAVGRTRAIAGRETAYLALRLPLTMLGAWVFGLTGATVARFAAGLLYVAVSLEVARRSLGLSMRLQLLNCWRSLFAATIMSSALLLLQWGGPLGGDVAGPLQRLAVLIPLGACLYILVHWAVWVAAGRPEGAESALLSALLISSRGRKGNADH